MQRSVTTSRAAAGRRRRLCLGGSAAVHLLLVLVLGGALRIEPRRAPEPAEFTAGVVSTTELPPPGILEPPSPEPPPDVPAETLVEEAPPDDSLFPMEPDDLFPAPPPAASLLALTARRLERRRPPAPTPPPPPPPEYRPPPPRPATVSLLPVGDTRSASPVAGNRPPTYPEPAVSRRISGTVLLLVRVDASGRVEDIEVLTSSGSAILDREAVRAVAAWRFSPALERGRPVPGAVEVPVRFALPPR